MEVAQYYAGAGAGGEADDTKRVYRTDGGREVRGGGGIAPDIAVPGPRPMPGWWSVAADSGYDDAVADSVALALGADSASRAARMAGAESWNGRPLTPLLDRVRSRLGVAAQMDSATSGVMARRLAARAAFVRWPPEGGAELQLRHDPDVRAALEAFPRMEQMLKGASR